MGPASQLRYVTAIFTCMAIAYVNRTYQLESSAVTREVEEQKNNNNQTPRNTNIVLYICHHASLPYDSCRFQSKALRRKVQQSSTVATRHTPTAHRHRYSAPLYSRSTIIYSIRHFILQLLVCRYRNTRNGVANVSYRAVRLRFVSLTTSPLETSEDTSQQNQETHGIMSSE